MPALDPITAMTRGIETILRELLTSRWSIEHVPDPLTMQEFQRLLQATPFVGIAWTKTTIGPEAGRRPMMTPIIKLTFCVKNTSRSGRLLGDDAGPGLYPAMEAARMLLHARAIDVIGTLSVTECSQVYADGYGQMDLALGQMTIQTVTAAENAATVADLPDFRRLATSWDFSQESDGPADDLTDIIIPEAQT
jgi:hypothetical protein